MELTDVVIVTVEDFSPFRYAVPCTLFGDSVSEVKRFNLYIYVERPGPLRAHDDFVLCVAGNFTVLEQTDIMVVPYWDEASRYPS